MQTEVVRTVLACAARSQSRTRASDCSARVAAGEDDHVGVRQLLEGSVDDQAERLIDGVNDTFPTYSATARSPWRALFDQLIHF